MQAANSELKPWLMVVGSFFVIFNTWGIINSFGSYQEYYSSALLADYSASSISWIGTIQGFMMEAMGVFVGPVYDSGYFHSLIYGGSFLVVLSNIALSFCNTYWQVFLAQGISIGFGAGMVFVPSISVVTTAFSERRAIAIGIVASASSLGGIVYPIVFRRLQPRVGFPWATRIIGFIAFTTFAISYIAYHSHREKSNTRRSLVDTQAFREPAFMVYILGFLTLCCGYFVPLFYIPTYAISHLHTSADTGFYLLATANAGATLGRLLPGFFPRWLARVATFPIATAATGIVVLLWLSVGTLGGFIAFCIAYGLLSGIVLTLATVMVPLLAPPGIMEKRIGTRLGMSYFGAGVGVLIGNPIAGALTDTAKGEFVGAQIWGGVTLLGGAALLVYPWIFLKCREKRKAGST